MSAPLHPRAHGLAALVAGVDFNRFPTTGSEAATFKQWAHVAVVDPAITLIANFSAIPTPTEPAVHRLTVLVRGEVLRGHQRRFDRERCAMSAGARSIRFDANELSSAGAVHRLALDEPALGLRARLTMREVAAPSVLHQLPLGPGGRFHWAVSPRLIASGTIEHAGRSYALAGVPAYRDRNWGSFCFGEVSWDWGYVTAPAGGAPCAVVLARLMDATRTRVLEQEVLVWWGGGLLASFRGREVTFACEGAYDGPRITVPPALALCRPGRATDVPETVTVIGASSRGRVEIRFVRAATARLIVPNEARLGTTAIHESFGAAQVTGVADGQAIDVAGHGLFECVHA